MKRVIEYRQLIQILTIFMIVQFLGLLIAVIFYNTISLSYLSSVSFNKNTNFVALALFYIIFIIIFSAFIIIISKKIKTSKFNKFKSTKILYLVEAYILFISTFFIFWLLSRLITNSTLFHLFGNNITTSIIIAALLSSGLIIAKNKWQKLRNIAAILASIGVGALIGLSFPFYFAFIFMGFLAIYDFIAVFITKHMITMAKAVSEKNLSFLIGINEIEVMNKSNFNKQELEEYNKEKKHLDQTNIKNLIDDDTIPVSAKVELGTGDLAIPLMVAIAALPNIKMSFFIIFGSIFGLILTMLILKKYSRALPAIPPLLFGICVSLLIYFLLFNTF